MEAAPKIIDSAVEVTGRLDEFDLEVEIPKTAVLTGYQQSSSVSDHDPPNLGGFLFWAKTVRSLRDQLVPRHWSASDRRNYATVDHPHKPISIAVAAGDSNTGRSDAHPTTKTEKGPATRQAVNRNQLSFEEEDEDFPQARQTWMLLHYVDEQADEIRIELSLPAAFVDGYVTEWSERVIPAPVVLGLDSREEEEREEDEEIEVPVERRAN